MHTRRRVFQGVTLSALLAAKPARAGRARSCIVLFSWGGMSHLDTWDPKPEAGSDVRGRFSPIRTSVPGIHISEHMPRLARQVHRMAIVRSVHHDAPSHRSAAYWNLTGHAPAHLDKNWDVSRDDWPCIGSMVAQAGPPPPGALPATVCMPYTLADGGAANGQDGGFLGPAFDPVVVRPEGGRPYEGVSPPVGHVDLEPVEGMDRARLVSRRSLWDRLDSAARPVGGAADTRAVSLKHQAAMAMLIDPRAREAFNLGAEPERVREAYGDHLCGRSVLLARRLTEAGVPLVTVYCAAGDLNGSVGAHWDTHGDNFNRLEKQMLPPLDQASAALLEDLSATGRLAETLVVWLTEFGRTPKINGGAGRDHFPNCYSVAFAGGGIAGGQVYGASDATGSAPADKPCGPPDLHATIFHALGIDPRAEVRDLKGRPFGLATGSPLPIFA